MRNRLPRPAPQATPATSPAAVCYLDPHTDLTDGFLDRALRTGTRLDVLDNPDTIELAYLIHEIRLLGYQIDPTTTRTTLDALTRNQWTHERVHAALPELQALRDQLIRTLHTKKQARTLTEAPITHELEQLTQQRHHAASDDERTTLSELTSTLALENQLHSLTGQSIAPTLMVSERPAGARATREDLRRAPRLIAALAPGVVYAEPPAQSSAASVPDWAHRTGARLVTYTHPDHITAAHALEDLDAAQH